MNEFMTELPPKAHGGRRPDPEFIEMAAKCRANPGLWTKWPRVTGNPSATVGNIGRGHYKAFRDGFEAVVRSGVVYIRYDGGAS